MPNRILRDWTDSEPVNSLDAPAERFFVRLIQKADDFGRYHADDRLLKAHLFPLKEEIRNTDITRWLAACEKAGLLRCYGDDRGRKFLEIQNFRQRTRQSESKFPGPPGNDGQMTVKRQSAAHGDEDEFGDEDEIEGESARGAGRQTRALGADEDSKQPKQPTPEPDTEILGKVRLILGESEMKMNERMWKKRIRENRRAMFDAVSDFLAKTPMQRREIRIPAAWLTDKYERCLKEQKGGK